MINKLSNLLYVLLLSAMLISLFVCKPVCGKANSVDKQSEKEEAMPGKIHKSDKEWKEELTPEQFRITREKGTEPPFTGKYFNLKDKGVYQCVCCNAELFSSEAKYDSDSGWPSFWSVMSEENITEKVDKRLGMARTEVTCNVCGAHLGHLFDDGPAPTMLRYCINSAALKFKKK